MSNFGVLKSNTPLSHCHRRCWGYAAGRRWSGSVWGHTPGPPGPQSSGSSPQHRPSSWTWWAASAGRGGGSCRTAAEGSGGSWGTRMARKWNRWALYRTVCLRENMWPGSLWKLVIHCFCNVFFFWQGVKVHILINRSVTHSSKNFWRPFILPAICCALFRLKKGFFGGRSGSVALWWEKESSANMHPEKTGCFIFDRCYRKRDIHLAYIGMEFAWSVCLSHTNSLYLLLTHDIFLVKHRLVVWNRRSVTRWVRWKQSLFFLPLTCKQIS